MPECYDTLSDAFAAIGKDKAKKRLWTILNFKGMPAFHVFWSAPNAGQIVAGILNAGLPAELPTVLTNKQLPQLKQGGVDKGSTEYLANEANRARVSEIKTKRAAVADILAQQWQVNTWKFTGHAEERMLLNFSRLYTEYCINTGLLPTVLIYNSDSPCTVHDPRASSLLQPRSCSAKLDQLALRYPFAEFVVYYYKAYHGSGVGDSAASSSAASSSVVSHLTRNNIELLPFTESLMKLCSEHGVK